MSTAMAYLVGGSYEGHLVGYRVAPGLLSNGQAEVAAPPPTFALTAHDGCVRAVAAGGQTLASSGTDHCICVHNLRKLRSQGTLVQEEGGAALHCLAFFKDSHLVSGGADGDLCIWRSSDWECLLRMKVSERALSTTL